MSAHVPTYLLVELTTGELTPERNVLPYVLDHLERCPDCAAALQVIVALRAGRGEALEAARGTVAPGPDVDLWGRYARLVASVAVWLTCGGLLLLLVQWLLT